MAYGFRISIGGGRGNSGLARQAQVIYNPTKPLIRCGHGEHLGPKEFCDGELENEPL